MAGKWFGRKENKDNSNDLRSPEPAPDPLEITGRRRVLLMGQSFATPAWEGLLKITGMDFATLDSLTAEEIGRTEFEVLIETSLSDPSDPTNNGEGLNHTKQAPALAEGGIILVPCYAAAPTQRAAELGPLAGRAVGYALYESPQNEAAHLVEMARSKQIDNDAWDRSLNFVKELGLHAEIVNDVPGLVFGRILACLINEAAFALGEEIATREDIDSAMTLGVNYPRGLIGWAESLGVETIVTILDGIADHYGEDRYRAAPILRQVMALDDKKFHSI